MFNESVAAFIDRHLAHSRAPHKGTPNGDPQDLAQIDIASRVACRCSPHVCESFVKRDSVTKKTVRGELDAVVYGFNLSGTQGLLETH